MKDQEHVAMNAGLPQASSVLPGMGAEQRPYVGRRTYRN